MNTDKLKTWLLAASDAGLLLALRHDVGTSAEYLRQVITGHRNASSSLAGELESFTDDVRKRGTALPELRRGDVSATCAQCPYYKSCTKSETP